MKLFGGKHHSHYSGSSKAEKSVKKPTKELSRDRKESAKEVRTSGASEKKSVNKRHKLTGTQRGLLMLLGSLLILALVIFGVMKAMIKPPERNNPNRGSSTTDEDGDGKPDRETFKYVDDDGNEVEVQFEAPGSLVDGVYNILVVGTDPRHTGIWQLFRSQDQLRLRRSRWRR